jgi:hypothetical protein
MQAGTEQDAFEDGFGQSLPTYYAWWQAYPYNIYQQPLGNPSVSPGDGIEVIADHSGYGQLTYVVANFTTNQATNFTVSFPAQYAFAGTEYEGIVERTRINNQLPLLADFGTAQVALLYGWTNTGTWYSMDSLSNRQYWYMTNCNQTGPLATTGSIGGNGSFPDYWQQYGYVC